MNLFIAIILEGFGKTNEEDNTRINENVIEQFKKIWFEFDCQGTGYIDVSDFDKFLLEQCERNKELIRGVEMLQDSA